MGREEVSVPQWVKSICKAELHAHLSGSVRASTLRELLNLPGNEAIREQAQGLVDVQNGRTLKQCFDLFPIIHELIKNADTLQMIVYQVLEDFASDNVVYLELRTTPRTSEHMSAAVYLQTVIQAVEKYHRENRDGVVCRLIVSVSRHLPVEQAWESVEVVRKIRQEWNNEGGDESRSNDLIVGFELSGNPNKGKWSDFHPVFDFIRTNLKLPVSLHFGEVLNDEECLQMLEFKPNRVGHAVVLSPRVVSHLLQDKSVGVEVCITSNLVTQSVRSVSEHPVVTHLIPARHPFCLCTDDPGIFVTTLSKEYALLAQATGLVEGDLKRLAIQGLKLAFCEEQDVIERLARKIQE